MFITESSYILEYCNIQQNVRFVLSNGPIFEWLSENWTEESLFMVQNVQYSNGPPRPQVT